MPAVLFHARRLGAVAVALAAALVASGEAPAANAAAARSSVREMASLSLESLLDLSVTGASRQPQRMSQAAASVSVVTGDELRALGYRTIAEALRSLRGLSFAYDRSYTYVGVRGFYAPGDYNTRVLLLVDGNRVNDIVYDQASVGPEAPVDIEQVDRIEFVPGQGSAVYGANALFGVVNVVTRTAAESSPGVGLRLGSGRDREWQATLQRAGADGTAWLMAASRRVSAGQDVVLPDAGSIEGAGTTVPGIDHEQVNRVRLAAQGRQWRAQLLHSDRLKGVGAPVDVVVGDRRNTNRDRLTLLDLSWQQPMGPRSEWQARVFGGQYRFVGDYVIDGSPPTVNRDDDIGRWWGAELRASTRMLPGHGLQAGLEVQRSQRLDMRNFDLGAEDQPYLDLRERNRRLGLWVEDQLEIGGGFSAVLGLRHDRIDALDGQWSPRLALIWRRDDWVLKALHGSAFRPPNTFERAYEVGGPGGYERNPALRSERVHGQELVAEWTPRADWRLTLAGFRTRATDLVVLRQLSGREVNTYGFDNVPRTTLRGLEAEAQWRGAGGWRVRTNLSVQQGDSDSAAATQGARRMLKGTLIVPLRQDWTLGLDGQAQSRRGAAPGGAVLNAQLAFNVGRDGPRLAVGATNLFDRTLADPGISAEAQPVVLQDRRRWSVQAQLRF